jgi:predicted dehydrogenase
MLRPLRAAVIGAGYLGNFHAQKYAALDGASLAGVVDTDAARASAVAHRVGTRAFTDYRELLGGIDVASIVVPTEAHYEVAKVCLEAGVHILVEKPVTRSVQEAAELVALAERKGLVFQVGHLERFNPAILAIRDRITRPLFIESDRLAVFKPRGTDVNVVLDLMIHDIDLILSFARSEITDVRASGFPVLTPAVDIANARIVRRRLRGGRVRQPCQPGPLANCASSSPTSTSRSIARTSTCAACARKAAGSDLAACRRSPPASSSSSRRTR